MAGAAAACGTYATAVPHFAVQYAWKSLGCNRLRPRVLHPRSLESTAEFRPALRAPHLTQEIPHRIRHPLTVRSEKDTGKPPDQQGTRADQHGPAHEQRDQGRELESPYRG